jgi:transcription initiation factor IIF auxiliary subunit
MGWMVLEAKVMESALAILQTRLMEDDHVGVAQVVRDWAQRLEQETGIPVSRSTLAAYQLTSAKWYQA